MISCGKCQASFLEALYNELEPEDRRLVGEHLASCPSCATDFAGLQSTLQLLQQRKRTEPDDAFWNGVWDNFAKRIDLSAAGPAAKTSRSWSFQPRWALQTAAAIIVIAGGLWVGRHFISPDTEVLKPGSVSPSHSESSLDHRVDQYLERSKLLLLGVANLDPNHQDIDSFDFTPERTVCKELLQETYSLKLALAESGERRQAELLSDLEVILLQISNLQPKDNSFGIELAKTGIRDKALLFKINLEEIRQTAEKHPAGGRRSETVRRSRNLG
jgi:hypothetical protein